MGKTKITGVLFFDTTSIGDAGKLDCRGAFTSFLAWAFPTSKRNWHAVVSILDLPHGANKILVSVTYKNEKEKLIASVEVTNIQKNNLGSIFTIPLFFGFDKEGLYNFHFTIDGTKAVCNYPGKVILLPWPRFTRRDLDFLRKTEGIMKSVRVNVACPNCTRPYMFEEAILSDHEYSVGVLPFPVSGFLICETCNRKLYLKDIQGRMRNTILDTVRNAIKGVK